LSSLPSKRKEPPELRKSARGWKTLLGPAAAGSESVPLFYAARITSFEISDLRGASLDKAGSGHPLKRVGIIQCG